VLWPGGRSSAKPPHRGTPGMYTYGRIPLADQAGYSCPLSFNMARMASGSLF